MRHRQKLFFGSEIAVIGNDTGPSRTIDERQASAGSQTRSRLPAERGNEVIDGSRSVVFAEAENRLDAAKSVLTSTMRNRQLRRGETYYYSHGIAARRW
jgi:hypothetical protein